MPPSPIRLQFRCNICGRSTEQPDSAFTRDESSCPYCGSCVRHRALMHTLSMELHGACLALGEWPERRDVVGVGLSDWEVYGEKLARKLSYTNTWFHREPRLDICEVPDERVGTCDFVIASDVFEHVEHPVERAFDGARKLLKPGGFVVFSVPWVTDGDTVEHFGMLNDWRVEKRGGEKVLVDVDAGGKEQVFHDLVFHGGKGTTLEMRVFSYDGIVACCRAAGFATPVRVVTESHLGCGMIHSCTYSLAMILRLR